MFIQRHLPIAMARITLCKKFHTFWNSGYSVPGWSYRVGRSFHKLVQGGKIHRNARLLRILLWNHHRWMAPIICFTHCNVPIPPSRPSTRSLRGEEKSRESCREEREDKSEARARVRGRLARRRPLWLRWQVIPAHALLRSL